MLKDAELTFDVLIDMERGIIIGCEGNCKGKFERCVNCKIQRTCFVRLNYKFNLEEEALQRRPR